MKVALVLVVAIGMSVNAQDHSQCYLKANGLLNQGANPSDLEIKAEMESLASQLQVPYELLPAIAYQESGIKQFASDGYLLHNQTECTGLYNGATSPNPPGLGMMQLTGGTANAYDVTKLRTDWKYNLWAGVKVLAGKFNAYKSNAGSTLGSENETYRGIIENWYFACWYYNGYVANNGSYADKIWSHINNKPGKVASFINGSYSVTYPYNVIPHFFAPGQQPFGDGKGDPYVARPNGSWTCWHGNNYVAPVTESVTFQNPAGGSGSGGGSTTSSNLPTASATTASSESSRSDRGQLYPVCYTSTPSGGGGAAGTILVLIMLAVATRKTVLSSQR